MKINLKWPFVLLILAGILVTGSYIYNIIAKNSVHMQQVDAYLAPLPNKFDDNLLNDIKHKEKYLFIDLKTFLNKVHNNSETESPSINNTDNTINDGIAPF